MSVQKTEKTKWTFTTLNAKNWKSKKLLMLAFSHCGFEFRGREEMKLKKCGSLALDPVDTVLYTLAFVY